MTYVLKKYIRWSRINGESLSLIFMFLLVSACGSDSNDPDNPSLNKLNITGVWETGCFESDDAPGIFVTQLLEITNSQYKSKTNAHSSSCANELIGLWEHNYNITVNAEMTATDGSPATNITLEFIESFHTMKTQAVTDYWNAQPDGFCGKKDWILDVPFEVTGNPCNFVTASSGDYLYDIVRLNTDLIPNTIQFGSRTLDVDNKPQSIGSMIFHKR